MLARLKSNQVGVIQYNGKNTDECIKLMNSDTLTKSIDDSLLLFDMVLGAYNKVPNGTWLINNLEVGIQKMSNSKFMMLYEII